MMHLTGNSDNDYEALDSQEMVLIENDWKDLMKEVPGAVNTRNFGL